MLGQLPITQDVLTQLADNIRSVFWIMGGDGKMQYVSARYEQLFGRTCASLYEDAWSFIDVVHPDDRARLLALPPLSQFSGEYRLVRDDGSTGWIDARGFPIANEAGQIDRLVGITEDITERKEAEVLRSQFLQRIIAAQEEERGRIARELHDTMAQSLTSLLIRMRTLEDLVSSAEARSLLKELRDITGRTIDEAQHLARALRPSVLDDLGFVPAVERLVSDCVRSYSLDIDLHVRGCAGGRMTTTVEIALYRILQEALTNVARHAEATHVDVLVERADGWARLLVEDNGRGFDPGLSLRARERLGLGIVGMQERAALLRGHVQIQSAAGQGTSLRIEVPIDR